MDRQLDHIELVAWQRRPRDFHRSNPADTVLAAVMAISPLALALRFAAGLAVPMALLQTAFALLVAAAALLLMRWAVGAILRRQDR